MLSIGLACVAYIIESIEIEQDENTQKHAITSATSLTDATPARVSSIKRLILHFSARRNLSWLYDTTKSPQSIPIMFGIK
jgi:hypothetical protein